MTFKKSLIKVINEKLPLLESVFNKAKKHFKISKPNFTKAEAQKLINKIEKIPEKKIIFIKTVVQNLIKKPMKGGGPVSGRAADVDHPCRYNNKDDDGDLSLSLSLSLSSKRSTSSLRKKSRPTKAENRSR